jgi:hydrogenase maturation protease
MSGATGTLSVVGFGNPLLGDDGVGLRVIEELGRLARHDPRLLPPDTRLVAAGPPSLDLLEIMDDARALLLLDAVDRGGRPGSVEVVRGHAVEGVVGRGDIGELLVAARLMGWFPDAISLVGIQVGLVGVGAGLSAPLEAALPAALDVTRRELCGLAARIRGARPQVGPSPLLAEGVCA